MKIVITLPLVRNMAKVDLLRLELIVFCLWKLFFVNFSEFEFNFISFIPPFSYLGSADRTVKFWDLETFELIGSAGPEVLFIIGN